MAVTVVRPEQQQQGQGMNQMLSMVESLNQRKALRREAQREDMINFVTDQALQRGGFHNFLELEGGEDTLKEYLTEGLGYNDEKAGSMLEAIRAGATPEELQWQVNNQMYRRGLGTGQPQQPQQPAPGPQGPAPVPQQGPTLPFVAPEGTPAQQGYVPGAGAPRINMSGTAVPADFEPERAAEIIQSQMDATKNNREKIELRNTILANNPCLKRIYDEYSLSNPPKGDAGIQGTLEHQNQNFIDAVKTFQTAKEGQVADAAAEASRPMEGNAVFAQIENVVSTIRDNPQSYVDDKGNFQYAAAASDIIRTNRNLFPDGRIPPRAQMNEKQKKFHDAIVGEVGMERGFYTGNQEEVLQGLAKIYKTVGSELALEPDKPNPSPGQMEVAKRQIPQRASQALGSVPRIRSALDVKNLTDDELISRRQYVDQLWKDNPQMVAEMLPGAAATRSKLVENRYKEALTKMTLMQEKVMASQLSDIDEADPQQMQAAATLDTMMKLMGNPEMAKQMPEATTLMNTIMVNMFSNFADLGLNADAQLKMFSSWRKNQLKMNINVNPRTPVVNSDVSGILGDFGQ